MNDGIAGVNQSIVIVPTQAEVRIGNIPAKDPDSCLQILIETRKAHVQLQGLPQAYFGFVRVARADQHIQRGAVVLQKISGNMSADVSGRAGQEYRHVAPFVPVLTVSPPLSVSAS